MNKSCISLYVAFSFLFLSVPVPLLLGSDQSADCSSNSTVTTAFGVFCCVAAVRVFKKIYIQQAQENQDLRDQNQQLLENNHGLRTQTTALGVALAVLQQDADTGHVQCQRDYARLRKRNQALAAQNSILIKHHPLLPDAAPHDNGGELYVGVASDIPEVEDSSGEN